MFRTGRQVVRNIGSLKQRNKGLYCADINTEEELEMVFVFLLFCRRRAVTISRKNRLKRAAFVVALALLDIGQKINNLVEPVQRRYLRFVSCNADTFTANFRFKQEHMERLLRCLQLPPDVQLDNGILVDKEEMLGYELTELCRIRKHVVRFIVRRHEHRIMNGLQWHMQYLGQSKQAHQRLKSSLHPDRMLYDRTRDCCLAVDGWRWSICRPGRVLAHPNVNLQNQVYSGFKKVHNLLFIVACSAYGLIVDFSGPYVGRFNDIGALNSSQLLQRFRTALMNNNMNPDNYQFIADTIFASGPNIRAMVKRPFANDEEQIANGIDQRSRLPIEWTNGEITMNWKALLFKHNLKLQLNDLKRMARCCAILTNALILFHGCRTQRYFKDKDDAFSLTMPTPEEYFH